MLRSGLKPVFGQKEASFENGRKNGRPVRRNRRGFWPPWGRNKTVLRAGLYARVSTQDQQTIPLQNRAMREYATHRGWTIRLQVREIGSGASQRERREKLLE